MCTIISYTTGGTEGGPERVTCRGGGTVEPGASGVDGREVEALLGPLCGNQAAERVENERWHRAKG